MPRSASSRISADSAAAVRLASTERAPNRNRTGSTTRYCTIASTVARLRSPVRKSSPPGSGLLDSGAACDPAPRRPGSGSVRS